MSKLSKNIRKKWRKLTKKRVYAEVSICTKDGETGKILHTYPVHRLYEGDTMEIGPLKFDVFDYNAIKVGIVTDGYNIHFPLNPINRKEGGCPQD